MNKKNKHFKDKKILLIGDTMLDIYIYGKIVCQSLDAPVPELEEDKTHISFGGNSLIAKNILELGGTVHLVSVVGIDQEARYYDYFKHPKLNKYFLTDRTRKTTVKRRWYNMEGTKLLQVNRVDSHSISRELENKIIDLASRIAKSTDIIVVMDPQHGMMTKNLINHLKKISKKFKKTLYVDAQVSHRKSNHHLYKGADVFLLNGKEAKSVNSKFKPNKKSLEMISKKLQSREIIVKLGKNGSIALVRGEVIRTKAFKVKAVDVCGAGDAFLAAYCLGDRSKPTEALKIANKWAALSTAIHGTIPPKKNML